jgi:hypothetical protein
MLLSRGMSVAQVVLSMLILSFVFEGVGLLGLLAGASESLMFKNFILLFSLYFLFADRIAKKLDLS